MVATGGGDDQSAGPGGRLLPAARCATNLAPSGYYSNTMPVLTFKVSELEARIIRARARARRTSLSAYLRHVALGQDGRSRPSRIVRRRHPVSGLTYNAARGREATADELRAALADFP